MRALGLVLSVALALSAGCRHRSAAAPPVQSITPPPPSYVAPPTFAFRDLSLQLGNDVLGITQRGEMLINGVFVGTLWQDGSFHNRAGMEIARLYPNGTMMFEGTLQDTRLEGATMFGPNGPIAFIDQSGALYFTEAQASVPVVGITSDSLWTVLFSMGLFGVRDTWAGP
jgi:hypothetical protein